MRIVVGEDQLLTREGIIRILTLSGHEVVDQAGTLPELLRAVRTHRPGIVVADVRMPPHQADEGLVAAATIRGELPGTGVLLLSQHVEVDFVVDLLARGEGGLGYLLKDRVLHPESLAQALARIAAQECVVDASLVDELMRAARVRGPLDTLSEREREVLGLLAEGQTNRAIANALVLSERTVEVHVQQVFMKLDLPDDPRVNKRVLAVLAYLRAVG